LKRPAVIRVGEHKSILASLGYWGRFKRFWNENHHIFFNYLCYYQALFVMDFSLVATNPYNCLLLLKGKDHLVKYFLHRVFEPGREGCFRFIAARRQNAACAGKARDLMGRRTFGQEGPKGGAGFGLRFCAVGIYKNN
jgi:hypothetical protein